MLGAGNPRGHATEDAELLDPPRQALSISGCKSGLDGYKSGDEKWKGSGKLRFYHHSSPSFWQEFPFIDTNSRAEL